MFKNFSNIDTYKPSEKWISMSDKVRLEIINDILKKKYPDSLKNIQILSTKNDGQIICFLKEKLNSGDRGEFLLDVEKILKNEVDIGINLWLEPLGDKNSLRNLRGIEIKNV